MTCQQMVFAWGDCLVEIDQRFAESGRQAYTAYLSLLEENGAIVRPLVNLNGRRIEISAPSEPLALNSAIAYLRTRFGALNAPKSKCALATSSFGPPVVVAE